MSARDLLPIDPLRRGPLARNVILLEACAEVGHGGRCSVRLLLTDRVGTAVDLALEPLGLLASGRHAPVGMRADGELASPSVGFAPVLENETAGTGSGDADAKTLQRVVKRHLVAVLGDGQSAQQIVSQLHIGRFPCDHYVTTDMR